MTTINCLLCSSLSPKSESARNYTLNLQIGVSWTEVYFWIPNVLSYPSNSAKSKKQEFHYLGCSALIPTTRPCLPVTLFPCIRQWSHNCVSVFISSLPTNPPSTSFPLSPSPSSREMLQQRERKLKNNPPLLTRTKMNCVRVQSPLVALAWNHCPWFLPRRVSLAEL